MSGMPVFATSARENVLFPDPASPVTSTRRPIAKESVILGSLTHRPRQESRVPDTVFLTDRIEVTRPIQAPASVIFDIIRSPAGHVAIDASGMLQSYTGEPAEKVGDTFVIHMDRESLNDFPMGKYDVTVHIITFERGRELAWNLGMEEYPHFYGYRLEPGDDGITNVTSYYDWS